MFRLQADSARAVDQFIRRVAKGGTVWILDDDGYVAGCDSHHSSRFVLPVFSDEAYAKRGAKCWGSIYEPAPIPLATFMEKLLPDDIREGRLIGPNWDGNMAGAEVEAQELLDRLRAELSQQ